MTLSKQAVDQTAIDYWTQYFGEYGKLWVREIPRNIRASLVPESNRTASDGDGELTESSVVPLGYAVTADRLILDGVFRGRFASGRRESKLFRAQFDHDGQLINLESRRAPAA